jgi:hypothetical protein
MKNKNRFKIFFSLITIFASLFIIVNNQRCFSSPQKIITFEKTYGGPDNDIGNSVHQTFDRGYIIAGTIRISDTNGYIYLIKTNEIGNLLWQKKFGNIYKNEGYCVKQTLDGGYIITGSTEYYTSEWDVYLIKTDSNGDLQWQKTFGGYFYNVGKCVQQTRDSGYIITGQAQSLGMEGMLYLIKTDDTGNKQWEKRHNLLFAVGNDIQQACDDGYIIAGEIYLIKADSVGDIQWKKKLLECRSVQPTSDGGYVAIAGKHLVKTDTAGNIQWDKILIENTWNYAYSIQVTRDSGYVITGSIRKDEGKSNIYLIKTDARGNLLWQKIFGGKELDEGFSVQQTYDGGYVIVGETKSFGSGNSDVYLIKTDSIGNVIKTNYK